MTEDIARTEPDLHLPPEIINNAAKAVAKIYTYEETADKEGVRSAISSFAVHPTSEELQRRDKELWRKVSTDFPHLAPQIHGLRSALRLGREVKNSFRAERLTMVRDSLNRGVSLKDRMAEEFLLDILIRRSVVNKGTTFSNTTDFVDEEAEIMRKELKIEEGKSDLKLQDVIKAALTGALSLSRQASVPLRIS